MHNNIYIYILVMALSTWFIRSVASLIMKRPIENRFVKSFLYYVPYVTLAIMICPAIIESTTSPLAGTIAFAIAIAAAWLGTGLFQTSIICCLVVLLLEFFL